MLEGMTGLRLAEVMTQQGIEELKVERSWGAEELTMAGQVRTYQARDGGARDGGARDGGAGLDQSAGV